MIKTLFLVPERDNDGQPFDRALWLELDRRLAELSEGFSYRLDVHGVWRSGDRVYRDVSREYTLSFPSWRRIPAWLALMDWVRVQFRQEALYIEVAGVPEVLAEQPGP